MARTDFRYSPLPGVIVHCVCHPTEMDPTGCDGLYVQAVYVVNEKRFQHFCNWIGRIWYKFSVD